MWQKIFLNRIILSILVSVLIHPTHLTADSLTWDGGAASDNGLWSDLDNWAGGTAVPGAEETATFTTTTGTHTIDLGGSVSIKKIDFDQGDNFTIGAGAVGTDQR